MAKDMAKQNTPSPLGPRHYASLESMNTEQSPSQQNFPTAGPRHYDSMETLTAAPTYEQKPRPFYSMRPTQSEFGRSCTSLANEQVHKSSILHWWWMEIVASVISIVTMFALITVLVIQDRRPLQTWDNGNITANTVVAAISTVVRVSFMFPVGGAMSQAMWVWFAAPRRNAKCKSELEDLEIFDEASRGAWGSLLLLWRLKKTFHLATVGAVLTIASLAFDIFTQQVLGFQNIDVAGRNSTRYLAGDVPRIEHFDDYTHGASMSSWIPKLPAKAALINGFYADTVSTPSIACSTGNCTWPIVPSLAVCGECKPLTYTKTCAPLNSISKYNSCNYTTPSGTTVTVLDETLSMNLVFNSQSASKGSIYNQSDPTIPYIAVFDAMYTPYNHTTSIPTWTNINATECALWFCMQAYQTTINDSTTVQTSINHSTILPIHNPLLNLTGVREFTDIPASMNAAPKSVFNVSGMSLTAFQNFIWSERMFDGNITAGSSETASSNDFMLALWSESDNMDGWIKKLAMGVTNYMRTVDTSAYEYTVVDNTTSGIYNGTAYNYYGGTAFVSQVHVKVRWEWLTVPLGLIALSVAFLILSILRTRGSSIGAWKSSPLALLFADVDPEIRKRAGKSMNVAGGLKRSVGEVKALLKPEMGGRWVYREPRPLPERVFSN